MKLSIVLPAFNEEENIQYIYNEIDKDLKIYHEDLEIIFVDDGSKDETWKKIQQVNKIDVRVRGIRFSRNFGHQYAVLAGLKMSTGDFIIIMDSDGQHPPQLIHDLLKEQKNGFDIVNTIRLSTADAGWFKRVSSSIFGKLLNYLSDVKIEFDYSDFRLMSRRAVQSYLEIDEHARFSRGLISWIGYPQSAVEYIAPERHAGITKWSLGKLIRLGMDGIASFSSKPLRISFIVGLFAIFIGLIYSIYAIVVFFAGKAIPGWPSMMVTILFLGGFQLLTMGIIGEYIARIFNETKKRPHFFIQDQL